MKYLTDKKMPIIISIIHLIITFFTDKFIFKMNNLNVLVYVICKIIVLLILYLFWNYIFKLIKKDSICIQKLKFFLIYFIPVFIILLMVWPGFWAGSDVINFIILNTNTTILYFLNYITSIFNICSYMLFFCPSAPIILQVILMGIVLSNIIFELKKKFNSKYVYLTYIPFFLPLTLIYVLYPNRPSMYGIMYLGFFSILILDKINQNKLTIKKSLFLSLLIGILSVFRTEGIYLVLFGPLMIFVTYNLKINKKNIIFALVIPIFCFVLASIPQKFDPDLTPLYKKTRNLPSIVNPLSYLLTRENFQMTDDEESILSKVLDLNHLRYYGSLYDTPALWYGNGGLQANFTLDDYNKMEKTYFKLILKNYKLYFSAKLDTFYYSSGLDGYPFTSYNYFNDKYTIEGYKSTRQLNENLRKDVLKIMEGIDKNGEVKTIYKSFNNLFIPLIFISIIFIISIIKRNLYLFILMSALLGHSFIVFLTAPASYFMYYFPIYLSGWFMIGLYIIKFACLKKIDYRISLKNEIV